MLSKKTYKNQITLPKEIIKNFPRTDYFDVVARAGEIVLRPVRIETQTSSLQQIRQKMQKLGITQKDIEEAIDWARQKK